MITSLKLSQNIRLRLLISATVPIALIAELAGPAIAQDQPAPVAAENTELSEVVARDPGGHWTEQALAGAKLLPLPKPNVSLRRLMDAAAAETLPQDTGTETTVDGANIAEEDEVKPDLSDQLFPENAIQDAAMPTSEFRPEDVGTGTSGAHFSSSRLVPTDARLAYPYRTSGKVFFQKQDGRNFICSGTVIRPRLILTAGHCVHQGSGGSGGFYRRILFVPAYHNGQAPYQAWNYRWVITTGSWASSNGNVPNRADLAIIEVEDRRINSQTKKIGQVVGWMGYRTNALNPNHTKKIGYPGNHDNGQIMHQVDSQHAGNGGQNTVLYGSDMRGGSSGGGWVENFGVAAAGQTGGLKPWRNRVVGVTSYGYTNAGPKVQGSSVLGQEFLNILNTACAHRAGNC
jgi:V8-like Glu-specific endopeptidase